MTYRIRDLEIKGINWKALRHHCMAMSNESYWDNVDKELSKFNATVCRETSMIEFESEEYYTWFILRWS